MWIEFLGAVGSGKSRLASALKEQLRIAGYPVFSGHEALGSHLANPIPKAILYGRTGHAARRASLLVWQAQFCWKHPKLVYQAWSASRNLYDLPRWHRKIIFSLFLDVAGWYEGIADSASPNRMVIVDEGLAHRAVNLFAWQTGDLNTKRMRAYLNNLPAIPLTILVTAPLQVCLERAYNRGLPARLRGKDPQTVRCFIENSHTVVSLAGEFLAAQGRLVIKIDNSSDLEQSVSILSKRIIGTAPFQAYFPKSYQTSFS